MSEAQNGKAEGSHKAKIKILGELSFCSETQGVDSKLILLAELSYP